VPHVLTPLVRDPHGQFALWNRRSDQPVATRLMAAFDSTTRRQGLLGRTRIGEGEGLVLAPCSSVHTAFMRFPIDLVFLDRGGRVLRVSAGVPPWRIRLHWRAFAVVELAAGVLARTETKPTDVLELRTLV
jgi:uncharacterized membrane protein (UPF0127 family)